MTTEVERWENEGGTFSARNAATLLGTEGQVEWAERIKRQVNDEFDRVAASFRSVANKQMGQKRADTEAVIVILEDKRLEVMSIERAGYFIRFWQEITDQVRQMVFHDARYQAMKGKRETQRH